jgi:transcriptional regulator with XRE-family HTH domain
VDFLRPTLSPLGLGSYATPMTARRLFAENLAALLKARGMKQKDLAQWCHHSEVWISSILAGKRDVQLKDLDRIADFFGYSPYQLFQPGIARSSERRVGERRTGRDRRNVASFRAIAELSRSVESLRGDHGRAPFVAPSIQKILADAEAKIAAVLAAQETDTGGQTPARRTPRATPPEGR